MIYGFQYQRNKKIPAVQLKAEFSESLQKSENQLGIKPL